MTSFVSKYNPKKIGEIIGQNPAVAKMREFLLSKQRIKKAIFLYGPPGTGKSCSVYAFANELGFDIVQLTSEDIKDKKTINSVIGNAAVTASIFGNQKLILIDELESFGAHDYGGLAALAAIIKISRFPVILIGLDIWDIKFRTIKLLCDSVEFKKIPTFTLKNYITDIIKKEGITVDKDVFDFIIKNSNGDLRAALNDLEALSSSGHMSKEDLELLDARNSSCDIFHALRTIFKSGNISEVISALDEVDMEFDTASLWISENITTEYKLPEEISKAYNAMSRSDVFVGRINRRQHYNLMYYANLLATAGVATSKISTNNYFAKYNKPTKIMKLFETKSYRSIIKSIAKKISAATHTSIKTAEKDYINMLRFLFKAKSEQADAIAKSVNLDKDEIIFLSGQVLS